MISRSIWPLPIRHSILVTSTTSTTIVATAEDYLQWCEEWLAEINRVLTANGTFWLAIGDEYAAELKVMMQQQLQLTCRSWVVWYYTFGVNCKNKFSRSHAHLFHMVKDPEQFHLQRRCNSRALSSATGLR